MEARGLATKAWSGAWRVALAAVCLLRVVSAQDEDGGSPRGFAIPQTRQAAALADRVMEHLGAQRYADAIASLEEMIVSHRGEVLRPPAGTTAGGAGADSEYVGAAVWARAQLAHMPEEARKLYATRYGTEAKIALEAARRTRDRRDLLDIARRFPITEPARDAWWTLGDLELELGHLESARAAWQRARDLDQVLGTNSGRGADERLQLAVAMEPPPSREPLKLPSADCSTWQQPLLRSDGPSPFQMGERFRLFPCVSADTVLVSDSLVVFAFDAWSGDRRWVSSESDAWRAVDAGEYMPDGRRSISRKEFFEKLNWRTLQIRPAAAAGVAVASLQIPFTRVYNEQFQGFPITSVIPERRLYAFDLTSGKELWNHAPPPMWDGESGPFAQRMSTAAPPVIAGSRVLVPSYRMEGRVDFQVGCYDLFTGNLLWSTAVISGQVELNMFGRQFSEFCSAPVTVEGDRVIVLTQLGSVAALDLFSGDLLWETLYDQVPLPPQEHFRQTGREETWVNAAPAVAGSVVVVTPLDSNDMMGLDLATGTKLWRRLRNSIRHEPLTLLGAAGDRVWLSGQRVMSLRAPRGLASSTGPSDLTESTDVFNQNPSPRPLLTDRYVIAPTQSRRVVLDRMSLRQEDRLASADWGEKQRAGNVAAVDGALFFATSTSLFGCIDWRVVEERYRRLTEERPLDPGPALEWSGILERRGSSELTALRTDSALALFESARTRLEPFLERTRGSARAEVSARLVSLSLAEARALEARADTATALTRVGRALELATYEEDVCRALVQQVELLGVQGDFAARATALQQLASRCGGQMMPEEWWKDRSARYRESLPQSGALSRMPVSLFALIENAADARRARNIGRELELLHQILDQWSDVVLPPDRDATEGELGISVSERIARLIEAGASEAYAPFEAKARALFESAKRSGDPDALDRVAQLYPHSRAALEAERARLEAALAAGDTRRVVALVERSIPEDWSVERSRNDDLQNLLVLGAALADAGNLEFQRGLHEHLARQRGTVASLLPRDQGKTIAQLATPASEPERAPISSESSSFDPSSSLVTVRQGQFVLLGSFELPGENGAARQVQLVCQKDRQDVVQAFDAQAPTKPLWSTPLDKESVRPGRRAELVADRLVVGGRTSLSGLDRDTGELRWRWDSESSNIERYGASRGLLFVSTLTSDGRRSLFALEAHGGLPLWEHLVPFGTWSQPVIGPDHVVLLPNDWAASPASVLDPYTGTRVRTFELDGHVADSDVSSAWIEGDRLILPSFPKSSGSGEKDCISAIDLESGTRAWRVPAEPDKEFDSIVRCGEDVYLIFLPAGAAQRSSSGRIVQLTTRIGATRVLQNVAIETDDVLIGVPRQRTKDLGGPYLFLRRPSDDQNATLFQAVQLPYGRTWTHRLQVNPAQFYNSGPMLLPVMSQSCAVLAWTETPTPRARAQQPQPRTHMLVLERENGFLRESSDLPTELGPADTLEVATLGPSLWIAGRSALLIRSKP